MPSSYWTLQSRIKNHLDRRKMRNDSVKTLKSCKGILMRWAKGLKDAGLELNPNKMGEREVMYVFDLFKGTPTYQFWCLAFVRVFLKKEGNPVVDTLDISKPPSSRINVDWLDEEEERMLWQFVMTSCSPLERAIVILELGAALRRVEVMRLEVDKILDNTFEVRGKGRRGGKVRTLQLSATVKRALDEWAIQRSIMIADAKKVNPSTIVPPQMIIHNRSRGGGLSGYGETGLDAIIERVRDGMKAKYGRDFDFSNHTLRRTCGRRLWKQGVKIEIIQSILGHESPAMTYQYLGINLKDQDEAMQTLDLFIKGLTPRKTEILGASQ